MARLYLGYAGNLGERVPELAGCGLLSVFPQAVIMSYFVVLQRFNDVVSPFEDALHAIYLAVLLAEIPLCYLVASRIVKSQAQLFYLSVQQQQQHPFEAMPRAQEQQATSKPGDVTQPRRRTVERTAVMTTVQHPHATTSFQLRTSPHDDILLRDLNAK